jgi:hypothetical protein
MPADPHEALTEHLDRAVSDALPVVQRQLDVVTGHLREAITDYETLRCIEDAGEPGVSERAGGTA